MGYNNQNILFFYYLYAVNGKVDTEKIKFMLILLRHFLYNKCPSIIINDRFAVQAGTCNAIKYFLNKIEQKKAKIELI